MAVLRVAAELWLGVAANAGRPHLLPRESGSGQVRSGQVAEMIAGRRYWGIFTFGDAAGGRWAGAAGRAGHFTPTYASCLNLVERWFAELTNRQLRRSTHRSVKQLEADVTAWIKAWNDDPKPFVWTKTADELLESLAGYLTRLNQSKRLRTLEGLGDGVVLIRSSFRRRGWLVR
jgi:transposase